MTIRGIIFDLGWTLMDFDGDMMATLAERARDVGDFLQTNGFDLEGMAVFDSYRQEMRTLWEAGREFHYEYPARLAMLRALRRHLSHADAAHLARGATRASFESLIPCWELYADTLSTLTLLSDAGHRLGCISNTNHSPLVWGMIERGGLRSWLSPIYASEEIGLRKPHPRLFQWVLKDWGLSPAEVVMVGDTLNADVLGAHNAGMRGVWIDRGPVSPWSNNEASKAHIRPDATLQQLAELPELIKDWQGG